VNPLSPPSFQGYFWLPESPDHKIPGRFYCTDDGSLELEVLGTFSGSSIEAQEASASRVLGISEKGQFVTLDNCFYLKRNFNFPGLAISRLHVNLALVGCHFGKGEPLLFDEIVCYSEAINDWLEFAPIEASLTTSPAYAATLSFSPPAPLEWIMPNGVKLKVKTSWTAPGGKKHREAQITQKTWVGFEIGREASLEDLLAMATRFCHFVSFVVDQTVPPNAVEVYSRALVEEIGDKTRQTPVHVFYAPDVRTSPDLSRVAPPFPLFSFQYARPRFDSLFSTWLKNYEQFGSSFNLYFATRTGRDLYLDNRFLMLAQALESLHRHSSHETSFPKEDYATLCGLLESAIPEKFKEWLTPRLAYGNEPSLRQRLRLLFGGFESIYGDNKKTKDLISRIVDTRNYLTHYDVTLRERAARGRDLWRLCLALETLFQLHMALLCGFSKGEVIDLCNRSQSFTRKTTEL
jgi:hypothetical protein